MSRTIDLREGRLRPEREPDPTPARRLYLAAPRASRIEVLFLLATAFAMTLGAVVMFEPAPIDLALMLLLAVAVVLGFQTFRPVHGLPVALLALFVGANVVSLAEADDVVRALWYGGVTLYLALSWVFFVGLVGRLGKRAETALLAGYAVAGVVSALLGTLAYFGILHYSELLVFDRPKGLFKDPNVWGPYLVPIAIYAMAKLMTRAPRRWLWAGLAMLSLLSIMVSFSRACWANCVVAAGVYMLTGGVRQLRRVLVGLMLAGVTVALCLNLPGVDRMLRERWGHGGLHGYDYERFEVQREALQTAHDRPLGIGPGQADATFHYATHNTYLRVLAENGWLGFATFYGFVGLTLAQAFLRARRAPARQCLERVVLACLLGWLVNSLVIDTLHWRHLWFLLAVPWCIVPAARPKWRLVRTENVRMAEAR